MKRLRTFVYLVCLSILVYFVGLLFFAGKLSDALIFSKRNDLWIHVLQGVDLAAGVGTLAVIYYSLKCWVDKQQWFWSKIWNTLLALGCVGFTWFIYHWNLLDFNLHY